MSSFSDLKSGPDRRGIDFGGADRSLGMNTLWSRENLANVEDALRAFSRLVCTAWSGAVPIEDLTVRLS